MGHPDGCVALRGEGEGGGADVGGEGGDLFAQFAHAIGEDGGAPGGFAEPEGEAGRRAVRIFDEDAAGGFDALHAPAGVAEEDDVAGRGLDGEVFVEGRDL
jgi:hypothetical protein